MEVTLSHRSKDNELGFWNESKITEIHAMTSGRVNTFLISVQIFQLKETIKLPDFCIIMLIMIHQQFYDVLEQWSKVSIKSMWFSLTLDMLSDSVKFESF